jgi:hypothetical protein
VHLRVGQPAVGDGAPGAAAASDARRRRNQPADLVTALPLRPARAARRRRGGQSRPSSTRGGRPRRRAERATYGRVPFRVVATAALRRLHPPTLRLRVVR